MHAPPPPSPSDDFTAARVAMLRELAEVGMAVARAIGRQAEAVGAPRDAEDEAREDEAPVWRPAAGDLGLAFSRVSRAVRLTLALEARMEAGTFAEAQAAAQVETDKADWAAAGRSARMVCKADDLGEILRDMVEDEADEDGQDEDAKDADRAERLYERLCEQLDALEPDEVFERPLEELVARICRDLGIEPDLSLYEYEAWVEAAGGLWAVKRAFARVAAEAPLAQPEASAPALEMQPP